jgi:hypothetical protein
MLNTAVTENHNWTQYKNIQITDHSSLASILWDQYQCHAPVFSLDFRVAHFEEHVQPNDTCATGTPKH